MQDIKDMMKDILKTASRFYSGKEGIARLGIVAILMIVLVSLVMIKSDTDSAE